MSKRVKLEKKRIGPLLGSSKINGAAQMDRPAPIQQLCQVINVCFIVGIGIIIGKVKGSNCTGGATSFGRYICFATNY